MFKELLLEYMNLKGLTQIEVSELLGDTQQAISDFLSKKSNPQKKTKEKYFENLTGFEDFYNEKTSLKQGNVDTKKDIEKLADLVIKNHNELMFVEKYRYWFETKAQKRAIEILKE